MKKGFTHNFRFFSLLLLLTTVSITNWSCRKKDQTCYAIVTVTNSSGSPIAGANVRVHAQSVGGQVEATGTTDGSGKANFSFKLQAIFNVDVTSTAGTGSGILKLEPGETVEKTIVIP